ncbi:unnamed protein product [Phyllotreta striolata]|uniref:Lipase domain-containing protein n=1 Tax=Phyllotreta striolata TaxID=444603 RepID=A0A9N9XR76_PHYSR|nr:unnamed protein product [Phyllotreta striolata]
MLYSLFLVFLAFQNAVQQSMNELVHIKDSEITSDHIKIYFYCRYREHTPKLVELSDFDQLSKAGYSETKNNYFYIPCYKIDPLDWLSDSQRLKDTVIHAHDVNFFLVDWTSLATVDVVDKHTYLVGRIKDIGKLVGKMIKDFITDNALSFDNTQIVGYSVGAHIAGIAGRECDGKLSQILGLDPASREFSLENESNRLAPDSALNVQVIHTGGDDRGFPEPIGWSDWYPNGGMSQPMCDSSFEKDPSKCSHSMAIEFYLESICTTNFVAWPCPGYHEFKRNRCSNVGKPAWMGGFLLDPHAKGTYYFDTKLQSPFAKG